MIRFHQLALSSITVALLVACGGGDNGAPGVPGLNSLINVSDEAAGANCEHGGKKVTSGADGNANGVLDSTEVSATNYICAEEQSAELPWVHSTDTAVQAAPNTGYLADNVDQVTITLPANPTIGDVIQVTGVGAGGWKIAQNAGQTMLTHNLAGGRIGETWTARKIDDAGTPMRWTSVASSADGMKLVAAARDGHIYTSTDAGLSWTARETSRTWRAVTSSADGTHLAAAGTFEDQIHTSSDSGTTWTAHSVLDGSFNSFIWSNLSSSASGKDLVAVNFGAASARAIYLSHDWGATWVRQKFHDNAIDAAASADGQSLFVAGGNNTTFSSTDAGSTWVDHGQLPIDRDADTHILAAASSANAKRVAILVFSFSSFGHDRIYFSGDSGTSWTARSPDSAGFPLLDVASSADGTRLVATAHAGRIHTSTDSGLTWTSRDADRTWTSVSSSADGTRLVAVELDGQIYTSAATPAASTSVGTSGYISARQHDSVELQYVGHGTFIVRSSSGSFDIR